MHVGGRGEESECGLVFIVTAFNTSHWFVSIKVGGMLFLFVGVFFCFFFFGGERL